MVEIINLIWGLLRTETVLETYFLLLSQNIFNWLDQKDSVLLLLPKYFGMGIYTSTKVQNVCTFAMFDHVTVSSTLDIILSKFRHSHIAKLII